MSNRPRRRDDRIFDTSYVEGLESVPIDELRRRKAESEGLEAEYSYARRLLQGKLDILRHDLERRAAGGDSGIREMIGSLPAILAEGTTPTLGRLPRVLTPRNAENRRREVERLASESTLARIDECSTEDLTAMVGRLAEAEREASHNRRRVQEVVDRITEELVRRYREGQEDPTELLAT